MITDISDQHDQQLVTNQPDLKPIIEKLLEEADFKDIAQLIKDLSQKRHGDIESNDDRADYMISKESAGKLSNLFAKISKNIDIFFQDFSADEFYQPFINQCLMRKIVLDTINYDQNLDWNFSHQHIQDLMINFHKKIIRVCYSF